MSILWRGDEKRIVRETAMFGGLPEPVVEEILSDCSLEEHRSGSSLFMQGERADAFFIVVNGWVKIYRVTAAGDEAVIGVFTNGQSFAEAVAIIAGTYPAAGETVTDARLVRVPCERLRQRILETPPIALAMIASTARHLQLLVQQIEQLKAQTGAQRVAEFLLSLAPEQEGPCTIALPYEKMLIAGRLGMKQETLSRAFARLRPFGVAVRGSSVEIGDVARLRARLREMEE